MYKKIITLGLVVGASMFASDDVFKRDAQSLKDAQYLLDCHSKGFGELCAQDIVHRYTNDCKNMLSTSFARAVCVREKMACLEQKIEKLRKERNELEKLIR